MSDFTLTLVSKAVVLLQYLELIRNYGFIL
jgi:hypothetical protein